MCLTAAFIACIVRWTKSSGTLRTKLIIIMAPAGSRVRHSYNKKILAFKQTKIKDQKVILLYHYCLYHALERTAILCAAAYFYVTRM